MELQTFHAVWHYGILSPQEEPYLFFDSFSVSFLEKNKQVCFS